MITTIPPPRPVSVNSLTRAPIPIQSSMSSQKAAAAGAGGRCTSSEVGPHDDTDVTMSLSASLEFQHGSDTEMVDSLNLPEPHHRAGRPELQFENLPIEIHEAILDHLFGERTSPSASSSGRPAQRSWVKALHHPRRKALSNLALISPVWRPLVQGRIYRHIKIKGTKDGLDECAKWFEQHPHLIQHVRHIEFWVPVWGQRTNKAQIPQLLPTRRYMNEENGLADVAAALQATTHGWDHAGRASHPSTHSGFFMASHNATLEDIFRHAKMYFPEAKILTLEAGHCKKPPLIRHFANDPSGLLGMYSLDVLPGIQTFVMRGAWNIMRDYRHWVTLANALPSLREWHCAYAEPRFEGYQTIARALSTLSPGIVNLNLCLEGFHNKEQLHWFYERPGQQHLCRLLGEIAPRLEHLTFTGNVCAELFHIARASLLNNPRESRLKSLDLVVKNCCRQSSPQDDADSPFFEEPSGITNLKFIRAFEKLVLSTVGSLDVFPELSFVRIRFIDLDSMCALLNPYFQLSNNQCTGLWSEEIVETLARVRPSASFVELRQGIYLHYDDNNNSTHHHHHHHHHHHYHHNNNSTIGGVPFPRTRPLSIHANAYEILSDAAKV